MLSFLRIQNLAIIEETEISFSPGLNIISGETGAGKSILLEALELLCGKRANADLVRANTEKCTIEAEFEITAEDLSRIQDHIADFEDSGELSVQIKRTVDASGKSRCFVNGSLSTLKVLGSLSELLLDITRQHAQQILLKESAHLALLDAYGVSQNLLAQVAAEFGEYAQAKRKLEQFQSSTAERAERMQRLRIEFEELSDAALQVGEREQVEAELELESHSETLLALCEEISSLLQDGDDSIERSSKRVLHLLERASGIDTRLLEAKQLVETASIELSEAALNCAAYQSSLEADPRHIESLRERLGTIARLERKYARTNDDLVDYLKDIESELSDFDSGAIDEHSLQVAVDRARAALRTSEEKLTEERKRCARKLAKSVEKGLAELNMKKARFSVEIREAPSSARGADEVRFQLAANPGEPFQSLAKVASGGELSRLLLVLKSLLAAQFRVSVHVFDEIDSGIGGAVAEVLGEKLKGLASQAQVIAVTHAPQVAAQADRHIAVEKCLHEGRTLSRSKILESEQRVKHLAAMLAGREVSSSFEAAAEQLLLNAGNAAAPARKKRANQ